MLEDVLFILVTCTQDESRRRGLESCIASINKENLRHPFYENLVIFDNGSAFTEPLEKLTVPATFAMSPENVGYWGALHWCLKNIDSLAARSFRYIHPVESDFTLYNLSRLNLAVDALELNPILNTVRTQEFFVNKKSRYFKNSWNPLRVRRSHVSPFNVVTGERVWFSPLDQVEGVYLTNWHAKVPALHRIEPFKMAIDKLATRDLVTELAFMEEMNGLCPRVGLLDGGIWWMEITEPSKSNKELSGSYSRPEDLKKFNYRNTRVDFIPRSYPQISVRHRSP